MRLRSIAARGIGAFIGDIALDLSGLDGAPVVAVVGANGSGKTTLLECWPGSMYRSVPSRGRLAAMARGRDSFVESTFDYGSRWTIRQTIDAISGKGEASVLDAQGRPALNAGQRREFDRWAAKHLPSEDVFFSSIFAPQAGRGIIGLTPGDRKAALLRYIGIAHYEGLTAEAAKRWRIAEERRSSLATRAAERVDVDALRAELETKEQGIETAKAAAERARDALAAERAGLTALRAQWSVYEAVVAAVARIETRRSPVEESLRDVRARLANNRALVSQGDRIRASVARAAELRAEIARSSLALRRAAAEAAVEAARSAGAAAAARMSAAARAVDRCKADEAATLKRIADYTAHAERAKGLTAARVALEIATAKRDETDDALGKIIAERLAGADDRITSLRGGLQSIASMQATMINFPAHARETLAEDDIAADALRSYPARKREAEAACRTARNDLADRLTEVADLEAASVEASRLAGEELVLAEERVLLEEARQEFRACTASNSEAADAVLAAEEALEAVAPVEPDPKHAAELAALEPDLKLVSALDQSVGRIAELEAREAELAVSAAELLQQFNDRRRELSVRPNQTEQEREDEIARASDELDRLVQAASQAEIAAERARANLVHAETRDLELKPIRLEFADVSSEAEDWKRLSLDLGPDGLQALDIDAACPELSERTNDLLRGCFGSRWTASLETTRLGASGDEIEGMLINVIDTVSGYAGEAAFLSGGEKVIVNEALALAFASYACAKSGIVSPSLVRDESAAAVDVERAPQHLSMLRRAAQMIGNAQILFASHSPGAIALADARIVIEQKRIRIEA